MSHRKIESEPGLEPRSSRRYSRFYTLRALQGTPLKKFPTAFRARNLPGVCAPLACSKLPPQLCSRFSPLVETGESQANAQPHPRGNLERSDGRGRRRTRRECTGPLRGGRSACASRAGAELGGRWAGRDHGWRHLGPGATATAASRALPSRGVATCACTPRSAGCSPRTSVACARRAFITLIQFHPRAGAARASGLAFPAPQILPPPP